MLLDEVKTDVILSIQKLKAQDYIYELYARIEDSRASGMTL